MIKIYIHHLYSRSLFLKLFANTTNRISNIQDSKGTVICSYKDTEFELVFNPELHDATDGYHLIDFITINYQKGDWYEYSQINYTNTFKGQLAHRAGGPFGVNDIPIMKWIADKLENRKGWLVSIMRTEKSFIDAEMIKYAPIKDLEQQIRRLKNHHIFSDNFFINKTVEEIHYPNHNFIFTNTIFQWNELLSIRWYYEFANIFTKLNPPYNLCFSIRNHKTNRIAIMGQLAELNNDKIYLSRTDHCKNLDYDVHKNKIKKIENIHLNKWGTDNWDDISYIENIEHYLEYIMRILPMAKMHILSETWDYLKAPFSSIYLSEKTYGFVLAKIPFISTHTYPYDVLQEITGVDPHPFYNEAVNYRGLDNKFVDFVNIFMENYDENYELCKNWVEKVHEKIIYKIYNENSFLDIVIIGLKLKENSRLKKMI
jgi:hypothetical protein